jgi:hypothetical protein
MEGIMTAPLGYIEAVAREVSSLSLFGSKSSELARLTLEATEELRDAQRLLDSHHAYIEGRDGSPECPICPHVCAYEGQHT